MNAVIRRYTKADRLIEELARKSLEVERLIGSVPGFVAYHAIRAGDTLVTVSICRDRAGTDETTQRAAQWVRDNIPPGAIAAPEITDGEVFLGFTAPQSLAAEARRV